MPSTVTTACTYVLLVAVNLPIVDVRFVFIFHLLLPSLTQYCTMELENFQKKCRHVF